MADPTVLDPQAIETLRSLSPDSDGSFLRELIEIYLEDAPQRLAEIETYLRSGEAPGLVRAAHTLKGSSGNFGARHFVTLSLEIETLAKNGDLAAISQRVPAYKAEYAKVAAALRALANEVP